ncbi:DUF2189 domain-containing protein [Sphingomonas sp. C3-2]|uniref:DUF2189 domain-containing protein n=1 Tax=Sphingomonas sp. C3-2 TaxID=3062169 RepID=UPI00294ABE44|nr:DUF2189 domain-containing protein [Sphingomonas sp. C3-2]WOK37024.1 DUF2189 domain-containing protein [Sphingomonas sp. C3-2]
MVATNALRQPTLDIPDIPIRTITADDLKASLREGYQDFLAKRGDLFFAGLIYPLVGFVAAFGALGSHMLYILFPIAAGLSLLGPLTCTGFYELARRREAGLESRWRHFFDVRKSDALDGILGVAAVLIGIFIAWVFTATAVYEVFFGRETSSSIGTFVTQLFTTPKGWAMMIIGNLIGLGFALVAMAVSVIALPLLVDKDVDAGIAMRTSIRAVKQNFGVMMRWGLMVAALLVLGAIPLFIGLAAVLPILGYATWHLYTRTIDRTGIPSQPHR